MQIDTMEKRSGNSCHIFLDLQLNASAFFRRVSKVTTLGEKIKQYRIQKGLSLRKLAKELGIDPGTLARWERSEANPRGKLKRGMNSFLMDLSKGTVGQ